MSTLDQWNSLSEQLSEAPQMATLLAALTLLRRTDEDDALTGVRALVTILTEIGFDGLTAVRLAAPGAVDTGRIAERLVEIRNIAAYRLAAGDQATPSADVAVGQLDDGATTLEVRHVDGANRLLMRVLSTAPTAWPHAHSEASTVARLLVALGSDAEPTGDVLQVETALSRRAIDVVVTLIRSGATAVAASTAVADAFADAPAR